MVVRFAPMTDDGRFHPSWGLRFSKRALGLALALATSLASGCGTTTGFEVIHAVPSYVLTVDDLVARVHRSPRELGVRTEGVQVVGVLVRKGLPCDVASFGAVARPEACTGPENANVFSSSRDPGAGASMSVLLYGADANVVEGEVYVLAGSVEVAPSMPDRWALRAQVLARVAPP